MQIVNLSQDYSKTNRYISNSLANKIKENIKSWKKILLYINKRWEYSSLICKDCSYIYKCKNCDSSLKIHKNPEKMICHICWYQDDIDIRCKKCKWTHLDKIWVWTQQIEDFLKNNFQNTKLFRLDRDSVKRKKEKIEALKNIENSQIIIWTKMINTGYDLKNIWLIWVILLEQELSINSYDAEERLYINLRQLIWRWSRNWEKTDFLVQTFIPKNESIKSIINDNYKTFFKKTLEERKLFFYPPFTDMLNIEYRNKNKEKAFDFISKIKIKLDLEKKDKDISIFLNKNYFKKYNQYFYKITLKWENLRDFVRCIDLEIFRNKWLNIIFE